MRASASASRLAAMGRTSPLDSAASAVATLLLSVALARPDWFAGMEPNQVAAAGAAVVTLAAGLRAWARSSPCLRKKRAP